MRHFTYEIDERNLRLKLKDLEVSLKEGSWESFEEYSSLNYKHSPEGGIKLKFSLNRNVVTLCFFGFVIISFSLLLFNFISIKNPKRESVQLQEANAEPSETVKITPVVSRSEPIKTTPSIVNENSAAVTAAQQQQTLPATTPAQIIVSQPVIQNTVQQIITAPRPQKPQASLASELRPTVITEDNEPDVKPD